MRDSLKVIGDVVIAAVKANIDPLIKRIEDWEAKLAAIPAGKDGTNGADGKPGIDGKDGQPGKDGRDAESDFAQAMAAAFIEGAEHE